MTTATTAPGKIQKPLSAGELAARSGVAVSTVHFYEAKGLIRGWRSACVCWRPRRRNTCGLRLRRCGKVHGVLLDVCGVAC